MVHALQTLNCSLGALGARMSPDTKGEFNLNTLCVYREIFESGKKMSQIQKYPDVWMGPQYFLLEYYAYTMNYPTVSIQQ